MASYEIFSDPRSRRSRRLHVLQEDYIRNGPSKNVRSLLQASASSVGPAVVEVSTAAGLKSAIAGSSLDILLIDHLDLTGLPLVPTSICPDGCLSPLGDVIGTRSIRVRKYIKS
jgi:hypothetical protein